MNKNQDRLYRFFQKSIRFILQRIELFIMTKIKKNLYFELGLILIVSVSAITCGNLYAIKPSSEIDESLYLASSSRPLNHDEVYAVSGSAEEKIKWSFESSKSYICITVWIMDDADWYNYQNHFSYSKIVVSDGSKNNDSGTHTVPYLDTYYVLFINLDSDEETTSLTYSVEFDPFELSIGLDLGFLFSVVFILSIIAVIKRHKKLLKRKVK